jgi:hypothetical protein
MKKTVRVVSLIVAFAVHHLISGCGTGSRDTAGSEGIKYIAFSTDKEAYFMPRSFRYGGGDSMDNLYFVEDLEILCDGFGIRNFLFNPDRLEGVKGLTRAEHKGNNVWIIDGGREITLLSTCVYLDKDEQTVLSAIDERLASADYAIIGSHDYREAVPRHLAAAIEHLNDRYNVEYVTVDRIGELVRRGEIINR